jgi:prepilin-type N-terminal cleavage/methylation domain-containing protein
MQKNNFKKLGFTLVELLVVIAIIGLLASIVLVSLNRARAKARDAKRLSDINQMITAIELYYSDNNAYPSCTGNTVCTTTGYLADLATLQVVPTYITVMPKDPINVDGQYGYYYAQGYRQNGPTSYIFTNSNQDYIVGTRLEISSNPIYGGWNNNFLNVLKGS